MEFKDEFILDNDAVNSKMDNWTLKQLKEAMIIDIMACHTELEKSMVKAICGREIRETAIEWARHRKLTPAEVAIASEFGYRA